MNSETVEMFDNPLEANDTNNEGKVGYGRPPVHSRFKPGKSGNPRGRPKGSKSLESLSRELLSRKVTIQDGGVRRKVSLFEAVLLTSSQRALQGDHRAAKMILDLTQRVNEMSQVDDETPVSAAQDQELIADFLARQAKPGA